MSTPLSNLRLSHEKYVTIKFLPSDARRIVNRWDEGDYTAEGCVSFIDSIVSLLADALELYEADEVWKQNSEK